MTIEPGDTLYGYCGGHFGREAYEEKIVMAVGRDWVLVRERESKAVMVYNGDPQDLVEYLTPEPDIAWDDIPAQRLWSTTPKPKLVSRADLHREAQTRAAQEDARRARDKSRGR